MEEILKIEEGIIPDKLLAANDRNTRFSNHPKELGIVPSKLL